MFYNDRLQELRVAIRDVLSPPVQTDVLSPVTARANLGLRPKKRNTPKTSQPTKGRKTPNYSTAEDAIILGYEQVEPKPYDEIIARIKALPGSPTRTIDGVKSRLTRLLEQRQQASPVPQSAVLTTATGEMVYDDEWRPKSPTMEQLMAGR